jgi:hypothetical protein
MSFAAVVYFAEIKCGLPTFGIFSNQDWRGVTDVVHS